MRSDEASTLPGNGDASVEQISFSNRAVRYFIKSRPKRIFTFHFLCALFANTSRTVCVLKKKTQKKTKVQILLCIQHFGWVKLTFRLARRYTSFSLWPTKSAGDNFSYVPNRRSGLILSGNV